MTRTSLSLLLALAFPGVALAQPAPPGAVVVTTPPATTGGAPVTTMVVIQPAPGAPNGSPVGSGPAVSAPGALNGSPVGAGPSVSAPGTSAGLPLPGGGAPSLGSSTLPAPADATAPVGFEGRYLLASYPTLLSQVDVFLTIERDSVGALHVRRELRERSSSVSWTSRSASVAGGRLEVEYAVTNAGAAGVISGVQGTRRRAVYQLDVSGAVLREVLFASSGGIASYAAGERLQSGFGERRLSLLDAVQRVGDQEVVAKFTDPSIQKLVLRAYAGEFSAASGVMAVLQKIHAEPLRANDPYEAVDWSQLQVFPFDGRLQHDYDPYIPGSAAEAELTAIVTALGGRWFEIPYTFSNGMDTKETGTLVFSYELGIAIRIAYWESV